MSCRIYVVILPYLLKAISGCCTRKKPDEGLCLKLLGAKNSACQLRMLELYDSGCRKPKVQNQALLGPKTAHADGQQLRPDASVLATASYDTDVHLWDARRPGLGRMDGWQLALVVQFRGRPFEKSWKSLLVHGCASLTGNYRDKCLEEQNNMQIEKDPKGGRV